MKVGVPVFSYKGFTHFADQWARCGVYTVNLGDACQTVALRRLLRRLEISDDLIIPIDRDTLPEYRGAPVRLVMNARFVPHAFPLPANVTPVFVGFSGDEATVRAAADTLRRHQPIGCRDPATCEQVRRLGLAAYVTGCVTLTMPRRPARDDGRLYVIYGGGAGDLPGSILSHVPATMLETARFVSQRHAETVFPLPVDRIEALENIAASLLDTYRDDAASVITSLHHAAAPCMAMGIPVAICRRTKDDRFGLLADLTPIWFPSSGLPPPFPPAIIDVGELAGAFEADLARRLAT